MYGPTNTQKKWVRELAKGTDPIDAAKIVGYKNPLRAADYNTRSPALIEYVRELLHKAGITDEAIAEKLKSGMDAKRTVAVRVLGEDGKYSTEMAEENDNHAQAKFTEMVIKLSGLQAPPPSANVNVNVEIDARQQILVPAEMLNLKGKELQDAMMKRAQMRVAGTLTSKDE
jgi:hypothetical protein